MTQSNTAANNAERTTAPVTLPDLATPLSRAEFLRLPPNGGRCPHTGMSRAFLNSLILPTADNGYKPPVRSFVFRRKGAKTGGRLIDHESLRAYIFGHEQQPGQPRVEEEETQLAAAGVHKTPPRSIQHGGGGQD